MSRIPLTLALGASAWVLLACNKEPSVGAPSGTTTSAPATRQEVTSPPAIVVDTLAAAVGKAAPDFVLKDLDGKEVRLSSFKGKTVVLEWFNPACPFVDRSHTKGSLKDTAKRHTKNGIV